MSHLVLKQDAIGLYWGIWDKRKGWYDAKGHTDAEYFAGVPLWRDQETALAALDGLVTCGTCDRSFPDIYPSARCPFEYDHPEEPEPLPLEFINVNEDGEEYEIHDNLIDAVKTLQQFPNDHIRVEFKR